MTARTGTAPAVKAAGPNAAAPAAHPGILRVRIPDLGDAALAAVAARLAETAEEADRTAEFPWAGVNAVHDAGLLTLGVGARYGGTPLTATDAVRVFEALGTGDPAVALITAMTVFQHARQDVAPWWPEELYRRVVAESAEAPRLLNALQAEPEWGSPVRGGLPATSVRRVGDRWVLSGRKGFATGSEGLAYHLVWAVEHTSGEPRLGHAIVPADAEGIRIERTWDHLGQRASSTHEVVYDEVEIPWRNYAGAPASIADRGARSAIGLGVPAIYVGVARSAQAFFLRFANERVPTSLGRPIATTERIRTAAGEIEAQLVQAEDALRTVAARADAGDPTALADAPLAGLIAARSAIAAVQTAVSVLGNPALSRSNPLERHLRDVLAARVHPPQDDTVLTSVGRRVLDAAASRGGGDRVGPPGVEGGLGGPEPGEAAWPSGAAALGSVGWATSELAPVDDGADAERAGRDGDGAPGEARPAASAASAGPRADRASSRSDTTSSLVAGVRVTTWDVPGQSDAARGTLVVLGGRGETDAAYDRFARRIGFDDYRVHVIDDVTADLPAARAAALALVEDGSLPAPRVLVGTDAGAALALDIAATEETAGLEAVVLAGLPVGRKGSADLSAHSSCRFHQAALRAGDVDALARELPEELLGADASDVVVPVLAVHGDADVVSPIDRAMEVYQRIPRADIHLVSGGKHGILGDVSHRSVAATVVLFLERLRASVTLTPIVRRLR